jgi:hypothetical protein
MMTSLCLMPVLGLITLLFQRTAQERPQLEDRWIGAPRKNIPKRIIESVKCREELLLARRYVKQVKEEAEFGKRYLREILVDMLHRAVNEGRSSLSEEEEDELMLLKQVQTQLHSLLSHTCTIKSYAYYIHVYFPFLFVARSLSLLCLNVLSFAKIK